MKTFRVSDGSSWIDLVGTSETPSDVDEIKAALAASSDFADFQARVAAL